MYIDAFTSFPVLETERLLLRQIEESDLDDLYEYAKDREAFVYTERFPHEYEEARALIDIWRKYWNHGYDSEAIERASRYGLTRMGLRRVQAQVVPENIGSIRAFEKAGFQHEGVLRNSCHWRYNGNRLVTMAVLSRVPEDRTPA